MLVVSTHTCFQTQLTLCEYILYTCTCAKKNSLIFIYFSKPLRLLYSLIIYEIVNFLFSLFTLCYFFLYLKSVSIHVIVHVHTKHVYTWFGVWCLWWFHYPGLLLHTELMVSLFISCTMRCEIWAQPAELPW